MPATAFIPPTCALPIPNALTSAIAAAALLLTSPTTPPVTHHAAPPLTRPFASRLFNPPALAADPVRTADPSIADPITDDLFPAEHALADEVWQLVAHYFHDPSFAAHDWPAERRNLSTAPLHTRAQTYAAARRSLRKLDDPYTRLLTPTDMAALRKFDVSGVGLLLTTDATGALVVATDPPPGSAAAAAGIARGDVLQAVNGVDVTALPAFSVSQLMQGNNGTNMAIQFRGQQPQLLMRSFPPASGRAALRATVVDDPTGRMGYIRLKEFQASAREEVADALRRVVADGAQWVVLDLRGNGGGVFEGALEIAGLFEGDGLPVARVEGHGNSASDLLDSEVYSSRVVGGDKALVPADVELALLMDRRSASSSEVLAGGLRDQCRAALVGERSFGKGVIQGVFGLSDGAGVVITVAEYRTPDGNRIQGVGLEPDVKADVKGFAKLGKLVGIERIDESNVGVTRQQVRDVVRACAASHNSL